MTTNYSISQGILFKKLDQRMVLLSLATNQIFELNDTGARVWELLEAGAGEDEILKQLTAEFEVEPDQMRHDLDTLLNELKTKGLIASD